MNKLLARLMPNNPGRAVVIGVPYLWLVLFFLLPFLIVLKISVSEMNVGQPPFKPLTEMVDNFLNIRVYLGNFISLFDVANDDLYARTYLSSLKYAAWTTIFCLVIGFPFAYFMARARPTIRPALLMLVMMPFWTSFLLRVYAWKAILTTNGVFNQILIGLGIIGEPLHMLHTPFSLMIGMVYVYLPFMILPLYANLVKLDGRLLEAAADLGATPWQRFWLVTVPLSKSGIIAGSMLVFIPCVGEFVIPELLGGPETLMIGRVLWDELFSNNDWPRAAAVAVVTILLIIVPLAIFNKYQAESQGERT
ncbi:MAG TPA: ABC transporter permease subunit [Rhodocyclaceae bacterium]|nr:ABC transporter permease subunit [Rhodocyclaceae bacterium]HMZ84279.1 ABC transporter permease subunit [Rhodocyclaceae bacterium]HNA04687.1 ABC transporter permease subunit [Rhodocyclaceae bacterium]HNB79976.1 ABC transporter permease subunit [Rhodocyclaceae bacterium]HNC62381.1 ABC transporter permease subunit [Rhodocyclaceae bacterium]